MSGFIFGTYVPVLTEQRMGVFRDQFDLLDDCKFDADFIRLNDDFYYMPWKYGGFDGWPDLIWKNINSQYSILVDGYLTSTTNWQIWIGLWEKDASRALTSLNGSFSLIIFDKFHIKFSLITDRFNSRPLFYSTVDDKIVVGNFPLAVATMVNNYSIDSAGLWALFMTARPVGQRTFFDAVRSVPAGTIMTFIHGKKEFKQWFVLRYKPDYGKTRRQYAVMLAEALRQSAQNIKQCSNDIVLFLSGGMDSRVAAAVLGNIHTVTLISNANLSSKIAQKVANRTGATNELVIRDNNWYLNYFSINSLLAGGMYNIIHGHFTKYLINSQKEHPDRIYLLGDLLENFNKNYFRLPQCEEAFNPDEISGLFYRAFAFSSKHVDQFRKILPDGGQQYELAWKEELTRIAYEINDVSDYPGDKWNALFRWYNNAWCPTNFMLESIKPFAGLRNLMFDNELFELLLKLPPVYRDGRMHVLILKNINPSASRIPNSNYALPPGWPRPALQFAKLVKPWLGKMMRSQKKMVQSNTYRTHGSWHSLNLRFREDKSHRFFIENLLSSYTSSNGCLHTNNLMQIVQKFQDGDDSYLHEVSQILSMGLLSMHLSKQG